VFSAPTLALVDCPAVDDAPVRSVLWSRLDQPGLERCTLGVGTQGFTLEGTVVTSFDGVPAEGGYLVSTDPAWLTTDVSVTLILGDEAKEVALGAADGSWSVDGEARPDLDGCLDVDLGISPSTNTLPIRRLSLPVGASAELDAAWVKFPELTVERLAQRYTRLDDQRWLYESIASGFRAQLQVDPDGMVIDYERIWRRVAAWSPGEGS
jgi:hypothetical protein